MHIILATLTLTLSFIFWPFASVPATAAMEQMENAAEASLNRSGKKITPPSTARKQARG